MSKGSYFFTPTGSGHVIIVDGDPWVEWEDEDEEADGMYKARVAASGRSAVGHRWLIYARRSGHNKSINVPEHAIRAAFKEAERYEE